MTFEVVANHPGVAPTNRFAGLIVGTAVGDALGLPREGLSARRARLLFGDPPLGYRFIAGGGMISDDTEHACMTVQALLASGGEPAAFAQSLAWRLRGWLLGLPAGAGSATLRSIVKLWLGFPPGRSGVRSAGNGPAMRAPVLGAYAGGNGTLLRTLVQASTRITHTHPDALSGAMAVAWAAHYGLQRSPERVDAVEFISTLLEETPAGRLSSALEAIPDYIRRSASPGDYAHHLRLKNGVSGYINHTVPMALYCWLRWPGDFRSAVTGVIMLGGDTDTTAAITGALVGATAGLSAIPEEWIGGLLEWPRTPAWLLRLSERLAGAAADPASARPVPLFWPGLVPRNLLFLLLVLFHGFRRLLPPY